MNHLILCRELPPAAYPPGGIGTYVRHMARLLAEAGETVHVIAQQWHGAPHPIETSHGGRLIVHRVALDAPLGVPDVSSDERAILRALAASSCPAQMFSWQAARLAESLVESAEIDIVEAQEWEAPLYFFQLRRAMGLGPAKRPPCLVHLHSPSEFIATYNEWDQTLADLAPIARLEAWSIRAADALVCPSRYLARQVEQHFQLVQQSIDVVPYPLGDAARPARTDPAPTGETMCFVGRLERRKGIFEWIEAAVQVAGEHPSVRFTFFGADTPLTGGAGPWVHPSLLELIPSDLRHRFLFRGSQPADVLRAARAESIASVVPSRWENLPYTCIESMAAGIPVLVSPAGGMTELVIDGESGWVASAATSEALADALRRVLATPAPRRAEMGLAAARRVHEVCANSSIVSRHLALRSEIVARGPAPRGVRRNAHAQTPSAGTAHEPSVVIISDAMNDALGPVRSAFSTTAGQPTATTTVVSALGELSVPVLSDTATIYLDRDLTGARRASLSAEALSTQHDTPFAVFRKAPLPQKLEMLARALSRPRKAAAWLRWRMRS